MDIHECFYPCTLTIVVLYTKGKSVESDYLEISIDIQYDMLFTYIQSWTSLTH